MKTLLHLEDIVEIETLQKIQDDFSEATGFAAITVDFRGKPITKHSGCSKYCAIIRNRPETRELCEKCDSRAGLEAARTAEPYIYICHSGFIDFAAPIVIDGQYLGAIMGGQVVSAEKDPNLKYILDETVDIEDDVELIEAYMQIPIVPFKKIESAANLMFNIANKIAEKGYVNVIQEELHKQSLQLIQSQDNQANLESALEIAELKTVQSQINRRFLIQTLNIIGNLSYIENAQETGKVTYALVDVIKFLFSNINKEVSIEEELHFLENYLSIHKTRLGNRINFKITVADEAKKMMLPSLILQPIVENAIHHGIETKKGQGIIKINIDLEDNYLRISIEDNGAGIAKEVVEKITSNNYPVTNTSINLQVIQQRLIERYKKQASLQIESVKNEGTVVTIFIPCRKQISLN